MLSEEFLLKGFGSDLRDLKTILHLIFMYNRQGDRDMKKILFFCIGCLFIASSAWGTQGQLLQEDEHVFSVAYRIGDYHYSESGMSEDGILQGIALQYRYRYPGGGFAFNLEGEILGGKIDYDGETWAGTSAESDGDDLLWNLRALTGNVYKINSVSILPYFGFGIRYFCDDQDSSSAYKREQYYCYSPLGIDISQRFQSGWNIGFIAEYDFFWGGKNKSHFSDVASGLNDPEVEQEIGDGYGVQGSIYFTKKWKNFSLTFSPFIRYWDIDASDSEKLTYQGVSTGIAVFEPSNTTTFWGATLRVDF